MSVAKWQRFCVVGVGAHARNKLIPALQTNGQQIVGIVSSQLPESLPMGSIFGSIEEAVQELPADTVFIISTPPTLHFEQVKCAVKAGRDVIVEKPAFVFARETQEIAALATERGIVVVEGFMHRYTVLYKRFMDYWNSHRQRIMALEAVFVIPGLPPGTFRQESNVASSCLYDMGCYAISLLADMRLPLQGLQILHGSPPGKAHEEIHIYGLLDGVEILIRIGVESSYQNLVALRTHDDETVRFGPFFYGRPGEKWITLHSFGTMEKELLEDGDAFQAMFAVPRSQWLFDQVERFTQMTEVTACLEALGRDWLVSPKNRVI